jgi:hypothetical protein
MMAPKLLFTIGYGLMIAMVIAPITSCIAWKKGYNPFLWFFTGGIIGLVALLLLPSANRFTQTIDEKKFLRQRANRTAITIAGMYFGSVILIYATAILFSFEYVERIYPVK